MQSANNKRMNKDVTKIIVGGYDVDLVNENRMNEFVVKFKGPQESPYEGGVWSVRVQLPDQYPIKSPSIGFVNKIYHPNIDEASGAVCLDVINQTWSPMYDLVNIFDIFLPQLLLYPNPTDPLNADAAALQLKNEDKYKQKIKQYINKYALPHGVSALPERPEPANSSQIVDTKTVQANAPETKVEQINGNANGCKNGLADIYTNGGSQPCGGTIIQCEDKERSGSELSDTSGIEMMEIDDELDEAVRVTEEERKF